MLDERPGGNDSDLPKLDSMTELLLTVLALAQESYQGPLNAAVPKRLTSALRRARKSDLVHLDHHGIYLEEMGSAYLDDALGTSTPFTVKS